MIWYVGEERHVRKTCPMNKDFWTCCGFLVKDSKLGIDSLGSVLCKNRNGQGELSLGKTVISY